MKINACSVAFRHLNPTAAALADYTMGNGFDGLEIWLPHARDLAADWAALTRRPRVAMLAAYLPLGRPEFTPQDAAAICALTGAWGAPRFRLFAGDVGSAEAGPQRRAAILRDLRIAADLAADAGLRLAVEIHPATLADSPEAAAHLLAEIDHPALGLNFDVLHVWEAGADPIAAADRLAPHILHWHLKTVTARDRLNVFAPGNVHDPKGHRDGICPLFDGALDYAAILAALPAQGDGSLEWFGDAPAATMATDLHRIRSLRATRAA